MLQEGHRSCDIKRDVFCVTTNVLRVKLSFKNTRVPQFVLLCARQMRSDRHIALRHLKIYPPAQNQYTQEKLLENQFLCKCMRGLYFSRDYRQILEDFPKKLPVRLRAAPVFAPVRIQGKTQGELFMYWFCARGKLMGYVGAMSRQGSCIFECRQQSQLPPKKRDWYSS